MNKIRICDDYSDTLGARHICDGDFSGEDFRENFLIPRFLEAKEKKEKLIIDLDGGYGNPVSFIEEAFGGLARIYGTDAVLHVLEFVSNDEPELVDEIMSYIRNPKTNPVYLNAESRNN